MKSLKILYNPKKVFNEISENATWGRDYIILSFLIVLIAVFMLPITEQILNNLGPLKRLSSNQMAMIKTAANKVQYLGIMAEPIVFIIKNLIFSVLLYFGIQIYKGKKVFSELFALSIVASSIIVLAGIINTIALYYRGIENVKRIFDIYVISLNTLFNPNDIGIPLYQFLTNINIFEAWFIIILIYGVSKIAEIDKKKSSLIVITSWLVLVMFNVIQAIISYNATHLN